METQSSNIMDLITRATWREAVTYRDTWPHEYVVVQKDGQQDLLAAFCRRILQGRASRAGSSTSPASTFSWATTNTGR